MNHFHQCKNWAKALIASGVILASSAPGICRAQAANNLSDTRPKHTQLQEVSSGLDLTGLGDRFQDYFCADIIDRGLFLDVKDHVDNYHLDFDFDSLRDFLEQENRYALIAPWDRKTIGKDINLAMRNAGIDSLSDSLENWVVYDYLINAYSGITSVDVFRRKDSPVMDIYGPSIHKKNLEEISSDEYVYRFKFGIDIDYEDVSFEVEPYISYAKDNMCLRLDFDTISKELSGSAQLSLDNVSSVGLIHKIPADKTDDYEFSITYAKDIGEHTKVIGAISYDNQSNEEKCWLGFRFDL